MLWKFSKITAKSKHYAAKVCFVFFSDNGVPTLKLLENLKELSNISESWAELCSWDQ